MDGAGWAGSTFAPLLDSCFPQRPMRRDRQGVAALHRTLRPPCSGGRGRLHRGLGRDRVARATGRSGSNRVNRGGSWNNDARNVRAANRNRNSPGNRNRNLGFRPASSRRRPDAGGSRIAGPRHASTTSQSPRPGPVSSGPGPNSAGGGIPKKIVRPKGDTPFGIPCVRARAEKPLRRAPPTALLAAAARQGLRLRTTALGYTPMWRLDRTGSRAQAHKDQGIDLAGRKPRSPNRLPGECLSRFAARTPRASRFQEPPRPTRSEPLPGPSGSVAAPS